LFHPFHFSSKKNVGSIILGFFSSNFWHGADERVCSAMFHFGIFGFFFSFENVESRKVKKKSDVSFFKKMLC